MMDELICSIIQDDEELRNKFRDQLIAVIESEAFRKEIEKTVTNIIRNSDFEELYTLIDDLITNKIKDILVSKLDLNFKSTEN